MCIRDRITEMTKNNKLNNQEELFARDCKLMNLKYEYDGYTGTEKWAVTVSYTHLLGCDLSFAINNRELLLL